MMVLVSIQDSTHQTKVEINIIEDDIPSNGTNLHLHEVHMKLIFKMRMYILLNSLMRFTYYNYDNMDGETR